MNLLLVSSCVRLENQRLILVNKLQKIKPDMPDHEKLKMEILKLTSQIDMFHNEIKGKQ